MSGWKSLSRRRQAEQRLDAELRDHIEREVAANREAGLDETEARRRANLVFGGLEQIKEKCRDARGARWLEDLARDVRLAARLLWRNPRFTAAATLAIALGVGANLTFFCLVDAVLLRPLPYRDPDRLVSVSQWHPERGRYGKVSGGDFEEWKARTSAFEDLGAYWDHGYTLTGTAQPESLVGWQFSGNLFGILGARPLLGRTLQPEDGRPGHDDVVVVSESFWRRRLSASPSVVGQTLQLDGRGHTVVGVMPREFVHPGGDVWTPLVTSPQLLGDRKLHPLRVVARLKPGVTRERAEDDVDRLAEQLARQYPDTHAGWTVDVRPLRDHYVGDVASLLWLLQGAVFVLLLIACANVANLMLTRAAGREREIALRLALGARAGHLLRQFLAEALLLASIGAAGGLLLAVWGVQIVPGWLGTQLGRLSMPDTFRGWLSPSVLFAVLAMTLVIAVVLGAAPLLRGLHLRHGALRGEGRGSTPSARTRRLRQGFLVTQVALSVCLLIGSGLLVRSFIRLQSRPFGFQTDRVLTAMLILPSHRYPGLAQGAPFLEQLLDCLRALPGVDAVGAVNALPLSGNNARRPYHSPGLPQPDQVADFRVVTPDYFAALGIPIESGRAFDDRDRDGAEGVAIVNRTLARRLWPDGDVLGKPIVVPDGRTPATRTVVGVVGDVRHHGLASEPDPEIYRPAYQAYWPFFGLAIRVRADTAPPADAVRAAVTALDGDLPVNHLRWLDELAVESVAWRRSSMALLAVFAGASLLLASFGVYSVVSYAVAQSSREIGVRMAMGAQPTDVVRSFLARGTSLACWGLGLGLAASLALTGLLKTLLFGVAPVDAATYVGVAGLTLLVTNLATLMPALAAARVDPSVALRAD